MNNGTNIWYILIKLDDAIIREQGIVSISFLDN